MTVQVPVRIQTGAPVRIDGKDFHAGPVISGGRVFYDKEAGTQIVLSEIAQMKMALALRLREVKPHDELGSARRETLRIDWGTFTPAERATALRRAMFVRKLDKVEPSLHRSKKKVILRVIDEVCRKYRFPSDARPSPRQVRNWYRIFVTAGRDVRALVDCHWAKGRRGPRYPEWEREEINRVINEKLLSHHPSNHRTARLLATRALRELAAKRGEEPVLLGRTGIGKNLISRMLHERDKFEVMVQTKNVREARRLAQSVQLGPQGDFVNNHWEVDHCLLDILVIDEETGKIAGRPWLTAIIDRYSRCIVGFSLSFAPPAWTSVMDALRVAIMPKEWLLADIGNIDNSWDCFSVPRHLTTDHGRDFKSNSMVAASSALGFDLHHAPPRKPWFKGKIERWFRTLQDQIVHTIPGTVLSKWENRKFFDANKYAVLTIHEVNWILAKWVVDIYHQTTHSKLGRTPAEMWKRGLQSIPVLREFPEDLIVPMMGLVVPRTLRHGGVRYLGLRWDHENWSTVRAYLPDSANVQVRIDPLDISSAYVYDPRAEKWIEGVLVEPVEARGLTLNQWVTIVRLRKRIAEDEAISQEEALAKAFEEIDDYVADRIHGRLDDKAPARFASFRKRTAWSVIRPARLDNDYKPPGDHRLIGKIKSPPLQAHGPFEESRLPELAAPTNESGRRKRNASNHDDLTPEEEQAKALAAKQASEQAAEEIVASIVPLEESSVLQQVQDDVSRADRARRPKRKKKTGETHGVAKQATTTEVQVSPPPEPDFSEENDGDDDDVVPVGYGRD
ncbi:DDE-type integrase/transposase/recombinase [Bradyrhizobium elkanii]|uniref:DDE-type integrase/transposase/recombinase n=1 Tax=Bradyrhizobium elkanii TaxID=29448 RepID=UPI003519B379